MSKTTGMQHGSMPGMNDMTAMKHGTVSTTTVTPAPTTNSGLAQLNPSATLSGDEFDQPAPAAVSEANKAGAAGGQMKMQQQPPNHGGHEHGSRQ